MTVSGNLGNSSNLVISRTSKRVTHVFVVCVCVCVCVCDKMNVSFCHCKCSGLL